MRSISQGSRDGLSDGLSISFCTRQFESFPIMTVQRPPHVGNVMVEYLP